jgi:hypothetical protein
MTEYPSIRQPVFIDEGKCGTTSRIYDRQKPAQTSNKGGLSRPHLSMQSPYPMLLPLVPQTGYSLIKFIQRKNDVHTSKIHAAGVLTGFLHPYIPQGDMNIVTLSPRSGPNRSKLISWKK